MEMLYECHITCHVQDAEACTRVANDRHWKTSEIARDPVLGDDTFFYLTTHSADYMGVFSRMRSAVAYLEASGVSVLREKIELILHDTKARSKA